MPAAREAVPARRMSRTAALAAFLVLLTLPATAFAEEPPPAALRGVVRNPEKVKAALAFLAAHEKGDEEEKARITKDPASDLWLMAAYFVAGHLLDVAPARPWIPAAAALAAGPATPGLWKWVERVRQPASPEDLERERRLVRLAMSTSDLFDAKDDAGLFAAAKAAESDLAAGKSPFAWLVFGRVAATRWRLGDFKASAEVYRRSARIAEEMEWPRARVDSLSYGVRAHVQVDDFAGAAVAFAGLASAHAELGAVNEEANALANLAVAQRRLERFAVALDAADRAIATWLRVPDPLGAAEARVQRALVLVDMGRHEEAAEEAAGALATLEPSDRKKAIAQASVVLGLALLDGGRHVDALPHLERAVELSRSLEDARGTAGALQLLATLKRRTGDARAAEVHNHRAIEAFFAAGDRHGQGRTRANLGTLLRSIGRIDEALGNFDEALRIAKAIGDRRGIAEAKANLCQAALEAGDARGAVRIAKEALEVLPAGPIRSIRVHLNLMLARAEAAAGDVPAATASLQRALDEVEATVDRSPTAAHVYLHAAVVRMEGGKATEALELAHRALEIRRTTVRGFGEEEAERLRDEARLAAEVGFLAAAKADSGLVAVTHAFRFAETARAMLLAEGLLNREAIVSARLPEALASEVRRSRGAIEAARWAFAESLRAGASAHETVRMRTALDAAYAAREATIARVRRESSAIADLVWPEPVTLADYRAALPEDTALLLYQFTRTRLFAVVVRRGTAAVVDLGESADVVPAVDGWMRLVSTPDGAEGGSRRASTTASCARSSPPRGRATTAGVAGRVARVPALRRAREVGRRGRGRPGDRPLGDDARPLGDGRRPAAPHGRETRRGDGAPGPRRSHLPVGVFGRDRHARGAAPLARDACRDRDRRASLPGCAPPGAPRGSCDRRRVRGSARGTPAVLPRRPPGMPRRGRPRAAAALGARPRGRRSPRRRPRPHAQRAHGPRRAVGVRDGAGTLARRGGGARARAGVLLRGRSAGGRLVVEGARRGR